MRILNRVEVDATLEQFSVDDFLEFSKVSLMALTSGDCICPARNIVSNSEYTSLHMPSYLKGTTSEKVVSVPRQGSGGLPAFITVLDPQTGGLACLMNAARLTAVRTASASLLSTRLIMQENPEWRPAKLVIYGSGEQAYQHARIHLLGVSGITSVKIVARVETTRAVQLVNKLRAEFCGVIIQSSYSSRGDNESQSGLTDADIICCCTPSEAPLFSFQAFRNTSKWQHITLIGAYKPTMKEVDEETFGQAQVIMVDSRNDCLREAGDLMSAIDSGHAMGQDTVELGELLVHPSRQVCLRSQYGLSVYKSVGVSVMDNAIAQAIYEKAAALGIGTLLDF